MGQTGAPVFISPYAVPALAMGGSGDVLAGCIAALLAQAGAAPGTALRAAGAGVVLHALAGRSLGRDFPARGCRASELADKLPQVRPALTPENRAGWERRLPWPA